MSTADIDFQSVVPTFTVPDVVEAAEYYRDKFGFEIAGYFADPPVFAIVWRGRTELFFSKANPGTEVRTGRAKGAFDVYLRVTNLDALAGELQSRGADIIELPVQRVYEQRELTVRDLNGLILCFGEESIIG